MLSQHHYHGNSGSFLLRAVDIKTTADQAIILPDGRALAEVFSVRILNIDNENPGNLYGMITATDAIQSYNIYIRDKDHSESIRPGDEIILGSPSRALSAADNFIIDFNLKDHDVGLNPDGEISYGLMEWNTYDYTNEYNVLQSHDIGGQYSCVKLIYAVMSNAAEALIDVILINGDDENPADVYRNVYAENTSFDDEHELFRRSKDEYVKVRKDDLIPLTRRAVALPLDVSLKIRADL